MMKPIDKDKVVAEIEKRIKETESMRSMVDPFWEGQISAFDSVLKILDTLETKEVDLDYIKKELDELIRNHNRDFGWGTLYDVATHFFELGLKTQKGEEVMTQEEFNTLMLLLQKGCDKNLIHIYDSDENEYEVNWLFGDYNDRINLKINKL